MPVQTLNKGHRLSHNSLPNSKILDVTKFKAFTDNKLNVAKIMISLLDRTENTVGKGKNAGYQPSLFFLQCFPKPSSLRSLKAGTVWYRDNGDHLTSFK